MIVNIHFLFEIYVNSVETSNFSISSMHTKHYKIDKCSEYLYVKHITIFDVLKQS